HRVEVPHKVDVSALDRRADTVDTAERCVVSSSYLLPPALELVQARELRDAQRAGDVGQAVIDTPVVNLLVPRALCGDAEALRIPDQTDEVELVRALSDRRVFRDDGSTFAGSHVLRREE